MSRASRTARKVPFVPILCGAFVLLGIVLGLLYLSRPGRSADTNAASAEAKTYLAHLALSDVSMQASENFMKQQVVEVKGNIANNGQKTLQTIEVYCIFSDVNGREIHRERLPIVSAKEAPLRPGEQRSFRLPFDSLPDGWNQAMPRMVIAQIRFAS